MEFQELESYFVDIGGQFVRSAYVMQKRLTQIEALVFDWDGVFNAGRKGEGVSSEFSETDAMGIHLLRYGFYRRNGHLPKMAVITGAHNPSALQWAQRENIDAVYQGAVDKEKALLHFCDQQGLTPGQVAYFFDDVQDLPIAKRAGLRFLVGRLANPLFIKYAEDHELADYISACQGNEYALREFSELLLMLFEEYEPVLDSRIAMDEAYRKFTEVRKSGTLHSWKQEGGEIRQDS